MKEGEKPPSNADAAMAERQMKMEEVLARAEGKAPPSPPTVAPDPPPFTTNPSQRDAFRKICGLVQETCARLYQHDKSLCRNVERSSYKYAQRGFSGGYWFRRCGKYVR